MRPPINLTVQYISVETFTHSSLSLNPGPTTTNITSFKSGPSSAGLASNKETMTAAAPGYLPADLTRTPGFQLPSFFTPDAVFDEGYNLFESSFADANARSDTSPIIRCPASFHATRRYLFILLWSTHQQDLSCHPSHVEPQSGTTITTTAALDLVSHPCHQCS